MLKALVFIASFALAGAAAAQHKWVDKNGKVHYGDTPPPGARVSTLRAPASPPQQGEATKEEAQKTPLTTAEKDAEFRKRRLEAEKDREKQTQASRDADDKRENCARAQEALRALEGGRVARIDSKGERYFLNDSQLEQEAIRARHAAQQWCS